jgi:hypothetical protein
MMTMPLADRRAFALRIRDAYLTRGIVHAVYEPGDGTHYEWIITNLALAARQTGSVYGSRSLHIESAGRALLSRVGDPTVGRAMTVSLEDGHYTDPSYIAEKTGWTQWTCIVLAELLCLITGVDGLLLADMRRAYPGPFPELEEPSP